MKRYLTDCAAGHAPGAIVPARTGYSCSATLYGACFQLSFAALPSTVLLGMAQIFIGPTGDAASISTSEPNALRQGPDGKLLVDDVTSTNCTTDFSTIYQLSK
jgi:hypothetical protein